LTFSLVANPNLQCLCWSIDFAQAFTLLLRWRRQMQMTIAGVLTPEELILVRAAFDAAAFVDGRETAGWAAKTVKNNIQAKAGDAAMDAVRALVQERLMAHPLFIMSARPKHMSSLLFARYDPGMEYGAHVDDALMGGMRSDISFTLFVDEPETYGGGELVMETSAGESAVKGPSGSVFLYPSTTLHRVAKLNSGIRRVCVGWAQSFVRNAEQREILFDLDTARRAVFSASGKTAEFDLMSKSLANLMRMWAET
jgi:PKHD-type hydroxylase